MTGRAYYSSPVGPLLIESNGDKITLLHFLRPDKVRQEEIITPVLEQCLRELEEYFFQGRKFFSVELDPMGSDFHKNVWNNLVDIPYGRTISYEELAIRTGDIKAIRAVGFANNQNPIAIIIPCHRVIGTDGSLRGYRWGIERKQSLLARERR